MIKPLKENVDNLVHSICNAMGNLLNQSYVQKDGKWYLFNGEFLIRQLDEGEVEWHKDRNHYPFIENGITKDHPDWWKEPSK